MKARWVIWAAVLAASHLAAYFAMAAIPRQPVAGNHGYSPSTAARSAKSHDRGERAGNTSHKALLQELLESDLPTEDFEAAYEALCLDWIKRDLRGALDLFFRMGSPPRYWSKAGESDLVLKELNQEVARQGEAVWHWMQGGRYGSKRTQVAEIWTRALVGDGQRELVFSHLDELGLAAKRFAATHLCVRANAEELTRIRGLLSASFLDYRDAGDLLELYRGRRVGLAGGDGGKALEGETDPEIRLDLTKAWMNQVLAGLPADQIARRLAELPGDMLSAALWELKPESRGEGRGEIVALVGEISRAGLWERVGPAHTDAVVDVYAMRAYDDYEDPGELVAHLQGISDPVPRAAAMRRVGHLWSMREDEALKQIVAMPESSDREEILIGYVSRAPDELPGLQEALSLIRDVERRQDADQARREWRQRIDEGALRRADGSVEEDPFKDSAE